MNTRISAIVYSSHRLFKFSQEIEKCLYQYYNNELKANNQYDYCVNSRFIFKSCVAINMSLAELKRQKAEGTLPPQEPEKGKKGRKKTKKSK